MGGPFFDLNAMRDRIAAGENKEGGQSWKQKHGSSGSLCGIWWNLS